MRVHRGRAPGVDRRRARARPTRASPARGWSSPAAWPSATATSSRPRCPKPTRSSGSRTKASLVDVVMRGRKPAGVRDLLELPRPAPSAPWAYVKVAEGCDRACAFCAIPSFRGKQRSRTPESIEAEVRGLVEQGVAEIVLVAQDLAWYGRDAGEPGSLAPLLRRLDPLRAARPRAGAAALPLPVRGARTRSSRRCSSCRSVVPYFDLSLQHAAPGLLRQHEAVGERRTLHRDHRRHPRRGARRRVPLVVHRRFPGRDRSRSRRRCSGSSTTCGSTGPASSRSRAKTAPPAATMDGVVADSLMHERLRECSEVQEPITAAARAALVGRDDRRARRRRRRRRRDGRAHASRSAGDRRCRPAGRERRHVRPARRDRARDGVRRRRSRSRRQGGAVTAAAAPPPSRATKRFGQNALATPANFLTLSRIVVAIPTLALIRSRGSEWADGRALVRDHRERQPRRLARPARRRDPFGRVPRPGRRQAHRARRTRGARRPRCVPVVGGAARRRARDRHQRRTDRSRAGAASCCPRSGSASTRRSRSTARSDSCCCRSTADSVGLQHVVFYVAVVLTLVSGLADRAARLHRLATRRILIEGEGARDAV